MAAKLGIPRDILWDMQMDDILPHGLIITGSLDGSQIVDCTQEMEAWCCKRADAGDPERARILTSVANAIRQALRQPH